MHDILYLLVAILGVSVLATLAAPRLRLPAPILLALCGFAVALLPGLPRVPLDPGVILLGLLPPLLYADAFNTSWRDFTRWLRPILMLAIGLVAFTTLAVGLAAKALFPDLPWAVCFLLGAVLSPTDTVAAASVLERLRVPRRLTAILGGESLVNDASGLVAVQLGVAVVLTGAFSWAEVASRFAWVAGMGVGIGLLTGLVFAEVNRRIHHLPVLFAASLLAPYGATLVAELVHASAVLAVVTAGFFVAWRIHEVHGEHRSALYECWELIAFLLNAACFVFIGLEIPHLLASAGVWPVVGGLALAGVVMLARIAYTIPGAYLPLLLNRRLRLHEGGLPSFGAVMVSAWCGMRGAVSLAAALAIPAEIPGRDVVMIATVMVIICTLVLQGLTLGPMVRFLGLRDDDADGSEIARARAGVLSAGIDRLDAFCTEVSCPIAVHHFRQAMVDRRAALIAEDAAERSHAHRRLAVSREVRTAVREAQTAHLRDLRDRGDLNDKACNALLLEVERE